MTDAAQACIQRLTRISSTIARHHFMDDLLELIITVASHVSHIKKYTLWLSDPDNRSGSLYLKASRGIDTALIRSRILSRAQGVVGLVATRKKPLSVSDVSRHPRFKEKNMARQSGLVSMLGVPMLDSDNGTLGVLNCFTTSTHLFSDSEITLLSDVANHAARAIGNREAIVKTVLIRDEMASHSLLGQATRVLMERRHLDARGAGLFLRQWSSQTAIPISHLAEAILLSE